jgi:hypothetical protein
MPYGCCSVAVNNIELLQRILGAIDWFAENPLVLLMGDGGIEPPAFRV